MSRRREMVFYVRLVKGRIKQRLEIGGTVVSFEFEDNERKADKLKLEVDNWDLSNFDSEAWAKGNIIEISWGYVGNMSAPRVMKLTKVAGSTRLTIEAVSKAFVMDTVPRNRTFEHQTRSEIVRTIAESYGYGDTVQYIEPTEEVLSGVTQPNVTDAEFLRRLANKEGFEFFVDFDGFHWHSRNLEQPPIRELVYYSDKVGKVISFTVDNDVTKREYVAVAKGRNLETKERFVEFAIPPQQLAEMPIDDARQIEAFQTMVNALGDAAQEKYSSLRTRGKAALETMGRGFEAHDARLAAMARGEIEAFAPRGTIERTTEPSAKAAKKKVEGEVRRRKQLTVKMGMTVVGDPQLIAKSVIRVAGVGERLTGNYYVKAITHVFGSSGYLCTLKLIRDGKNRRSAKLFAGSVGGKGRGGFTECMPAMMALLKEIPFLNRTWNTLRTRGNIPPVKEASINSAIAIINGNAAALMADPSATRVGIIRQRAASIMQAELELEALGLFTASLHADAFSVRMLASNAEAACNRDLEKMVGAQAALNDKRVTQGTLDVTVFGKKAKKHYRKRASDGGIDVSYEWVDTRGRENLK